MNWLNKTLLFIMLSVLSLDLTGQNIDIEVLRYINKPETQSSDKFFRFVSNSDAWVVIGTPSVMAITGLISHDRNLLRNAGVTAAATIVNVGLSSALKYTVKRNRPVEDFPDINQKMDTHGPSFPSGHTSNAFATATSISLAYPEWYVIVPSFAYAGTVAYSRMHLGTHYPTDVLAGAVIGIGSAFLSYKINKLLLKKSGK